MSQITLRGIAPEVEKEVRKISKTTGKSLNRVIQEILYEHIGSDKKLKAAPAESLRKLAGGWSEEEAAEFLDILKTCRQLDEDMWR
jgi:hypothetical protein